MCLRILEERGESCGSSFTYTLHSWSSMSLWLHERLRVRAHGSPHGSSWINFSSAAWESLICLLYYLCTDSCFSTLFLSQQAWKMIKENLVQNNHSQRSNRLWLNFLISFNLKNSREPHERTAWKCWLQTNTSNSVSLFSKALEDTCTEELMSSTWNCLFKLEMLLHYWTNFIESHLK